MTTRRIRIAYRIPKATNTHSEYVIFIAIPLQQWLHVRASLLHYTHTAGIVIPSFVSAFVKSCEVLHNVRPHSLAPV
jgi:hypothetical protein